MSTPTTVTTRARNVITPVTVASPKIPRLIRRAQLRRLRGVNRALMATTSEVGEVRSRHYRAGQQDAGASVQRCWNGREPSRTRAVMRSVDRVQRTGTIPSIMQNDAAPAKGSIREAGPAAARGLDAVTGRWGVVRTPRGCRRPNRTSNVRLQRFTTGSFATYEGYCELAG